MRIKGLGLGGLVAIVTLVGCGSGSGTGGTGGQTSTGTGGGTGSGKGGTTGSGGSFTTSVPSGTKVTGLTAAQAAQLCSDVESYVDNTFFPAICRATASSLSGPEAAYLDLLQDPTASTSELQAACASAATRDSGSACPDTFVDAGTQTCNISQIPSTCQATVGDYAKCINDSTAADLQLYASAPSCSTLTAASLMAYFAADGGSSNPPEPASCSTFESTCSVDGGVAVMPTISARMMPRPAR
jgi:hypothetical protein